MSWASSPHRRNLRRSSSDSPIIIGYAHDAKSGKAEQAIRDGAAVIIWSFVHFAIDDEDDSQQMHQSGKIETKLDLGQIRRIQDEYDTVIHWAAFGGWNRPHPPASMTGKQWFNVFMQFNKLNGHLFDGIDWDYKGHDDLTSPTVIFTVETLDIMADFSVEAKKNGMIVSMAPAESYLDATADGIDAEFSLSLDVLPRAWTSDRYHASDADRELVKSKGFSHAGRQCYAYVLAKAGLDTFDWISIQLYEAYSPFAHDVHQRKVEPAEALMRRIHRVQEGYTVTGLPFERSEYEVKVPPTKLVIGIANGWVDGLKFCKVEPPSIRLAYEATLAEYGEGFLGVMFWTVEEEGKDEDSRFTHSLNRELKRIGQLSNEL